MSDIKVCAIIAAALIIPLVGIGLAVYFDNQAWLVLCFAFVVLLG